MFDKILEIEDIIFWGATGQSIVLAEMLVDKGLNLKALFDNNKNCQSPWPHIPIFHDKLNLIDYKGCFFAVAIAGGRGRDRLTIAEELISEGLKPITLIHNTAYVSLSSTIEIGSQILPMAKVSSRVKLGRYSIVNTGASVDHECEIGAGSHLAPNATLCGNVQLGECVFVGAGAVILPRLVVGNDAIIGAGAVVTKDVPSGAIIVGVPGRNLDKSIKIP
jgi:sugar O-acyltransferase (sialic acid O-acetyltransferase NeuD family)